jgi:hypothetical protein
MAPSPMLSSIVAKTVLKVLRFIMLVSWVEKN